uniref:Uncharacterized protein n=1 Tax=Panagrellus redivivus TaxID=6233 RepID=A0A7E4V3D7_PANRE
MSPGGFSSCQRATVWLPPDNCRFLCGADSGSRKQKPVLSSMYSIQKTVKRRQAEATNLRALTEEAIRTVGYPRSFQVMLTCSITMKRPQTTADSYAGVTDVFCVNRECPSKSHRILDSTNFD